MLYELTILEARNRLTSLNRDTKHSLTDHATEVKKLVEAAYVDFPKEHRQEMALDLFCNSLNPAYLQRHLLAMKLQSLTNANPKVTIRQIDEETGPDSA